MTEALKKKVIEAGIIPAQAVKLMKQWRLLDEDLPDAAMLHVTEERLLEFVSQISDLLEATEVLPELKETMLDVRGDLFQEQAETCKVTLMRDGRVFGFLYTKMLRDSHGCHIFSSDPDGVPVCGNVVWTVDGGAWVINEVMPIYEGEKIKFVRCRVTPVSDSDRLLLEESHAKMSGV